MRSRAPYVLVLFMAAFALPPVAARLGLALDGLGRAVAARIAARVMSAAMILLVWRRLRRIEGEIAGLLARFQAGRLVVLGRPRLSGRLGGARAERARLPVGFGWLLALVPGEAACFAGQIRAALAEPEMVALLQAAPQARRSLRPLCRMLGLEPGVLAPRAAGADAVTRSDAGGLNGSPKPGFDDVASAAAMPGYSASPLERRSGGPPWT